MLEPLITPATPGPLAGESPHAGSRIRSADGRGGPGATARPACWGAAALVLALLLGAGYLTTELRMLVPEAEPLAVGLDEADTGVLIVQRGRSVIWINAGRVPHTITARDGSFDSGILAPGQSWTLSAAASGTFPFSCTLHSSPSGVLIVE